jgi:hypothetical protein
MLSQKNQVVDTWLLLQVSQVQPNAIYVGITRFTPDGITTIYWIAFQIKKRGLLKSIRALFSIGQSEQ